MKRRTTTVEKIRTVTRIMAGPERGQEDICLIHSEQKGSPRRNWTARQIRLERARQRQIWRAGGDVRGLNSVGMAGLRRG